MTEDDLVGPGLLIHRIAEATASHGRTIDVTWTTGEKVKIDLSPLIAKHWVFARLRTDDDFFKTMQIGERGHDVFWPEEENCAIPVSSMEEYAVPRSV